MTLKDLFSRVGEGEVVPVATINGKFTDEYIESNPKPFINLIVQNDMEKADVVWVYDPTIRLNREYNP